jgi:retron-type reverse transcriptase
LKTPALKFFLHVEENLLQLQRELATQTYQPGEYKTFEIVRPKRRMISAAPFRDRVAHHALCNVIAPRFERLFIFDSYANRAGKGTHAAIRRLQHFMRRAKYVLKCDLRQYFPSIDHEILKQIIRNVVADAETLWLIDKIIDGSNPQIETNWYFPGDDLFTPFERRRGLPIGNLTSQFFANVYLNAFDHFVKEILRCRFYVRYVDDAVFLHDSPAYLLSLAPRLQDFLDGFRLKLYLQKCQIRPVESEQRFLGQIVFPTHRRLAPENVRAFTQRYAMLRREWQRRQLSVFEFGQRVRSWLGHARQADTLRLRGEVFVARKKRLRNSRRWAILTLSL